MLCSDESSSSCVNINNEYTTDLNNDCTTNSRIDIEQNIESNENNEILVHCENDNTLRQSDEYDISDSEESVNFSYNEPNDITFEITSSNLQHNLATWAVEHKITHTALKALLQKLKKYSCFSSLSLDVRSLLKTPRQ